MTTACSTEPDEGARLAGTSTSRCSTNQNLHLVASQGQQQGTIRVPNPSVTRESDAKPLRNDSLPVVTTDSGERIIAFPGGVTSDGQPIMADEVAVTDLENYPYETYQGNQGNCAPRAFEVVTDVYDPYTESVLNGTESEVRIGARTFVPRPNTRKPQVGEVLGYKPFEDRSGLHAGVVTGYDENGDVIVATGWRSEPYQVVPTERIRASYEEVHEEN